MTADTLVAHLRLEFMPGACAHTMAAARTAGGGLWAARCPECRVVGPPAETRLAARDALLEAFPPGDVARCWSCDGGEAVEPEACPVCDRCARCGGLAPVFVPDRHGRRWCLLCALTAERSPALGLTLRALAAAAERAERTRRG